MMNEKTQETYKVEFGRLMTRYAILARVIKDYEKELKEVQSSIDKLMAEIVEEKKDGESIQQA